MGFVCNICYLVRPPLVVALKTVRRGLGRLGLRDEGRGVIRDQGRGPLVVRQILELQLFITVSAVLLNEPPLIISRDQAGHLALHLPLLLAGFLGQGASAVRYQARLLALANGLGSGGRDGSLLRRKLRGHIGVNTDSILLVGRVVGLGAWQVDLLGLAFGIKTGLLAPLPGLGLVFTSALSFDQGLVGRYGRHVAVRGCLALQICVSEALSQIRHGPMLGSELGKAIGSPLRPGQHLWIIVGLGQVGLASLLGV